MIDTRSIGTTLLTFLAFFPFIGVMPGVDVQPNFLLVAILVAFFGFSYIKVRTEALSLLFLMLVLCMARGLVDAQEVNISYLISFLAALITPVLIWYLVKAELFYIDLVMLKGFIFIYLIVAAIQHYYLPEFLAFLVQRDNVELLLESGRGVRSLTPEPSTFGRVLLALNILYVFILMVRKDDGFILKSFAVTFILVVSNYALSQSFYAVVFHALFCLALLLCLRFKFAVLVMVIVAILFPVLISFILASGDENGRFHYILNALINDIDIIMEQGAFSRVMNVPISIYGGLVHGPFGAGLDSEIVDGTFSIFGYPYNFVVGSRNLGGIIEFFLRLGILSIPFFALYMVLLVRIARFSYVYKSKRYRVGACFALALLLIGFFDGSPSNPTVWFLTFFIYNYVRQHGGSVMSRGDEGLLNEPRNFC